MRGLFLAGIVVAVIAATAFLTPRSPAPTEPPKPIKKTGKGITPESARDWADAASKWAGVYHQFQGTFGGNPKPANPTMSPGVIGEAAGSAVAGSAAGWGGFTAGAIKGTGA